MTLRKLFLPLLMGSLLLVLSMAVPTSHAQDADRFYPQTGYAVENDAIWNYFQSRGGVSTFGYPVSNTVLFRGFPIQVFQRHVLQVVDGVARPVNLLDPVFLPISNFGGLTFPDYNADLAAQAPAPDTPNYGEAVRQYLQRTVPNNWEGMPVDFYNYYLSSAPEGTANSILGALEVWGFPTSQPMRDPNNFNYVYQRFQRGIMHYDATQNVTRGILLGDAFKQVLRGQGLSPQLRAEVADSPLLNLYAPQQPSGIAHAAPELQPPITYENTNLAGAFTPEDDVPSPGAPTFERVDVYLIQLNTGGPVGCNDSVVAVERVLEEPTTMPLTAAIRELLSIEEQYYGQSGFYNALYQTDLHIQDITLQDDGHAVIRLQGEYQVGGVCDEPRVVAQLRQTALQYNTVTSVEIYINGERIE